MDIPDLVKLMEETDPASIRRMRASLDEERVEDHLADPEPDREMVEPDEAEDERQYVEFDVDAAD